MPSRRATQQQHRKQHLRALEDPGTRQMVEDLKRNWSILSKTARGDQVCVVLQRGCTARGLASDLQISDASVLRYQAIAKLSAEQRALIDSGANPEPFLKAARIAARNRIYREKVAEPNSRQLEIDRIAKLLHEFMDEKGLTHSTHRENLLNRVRLCEYESQLLASTNPTRYPMPVPAPANANPKRIIADCSPRLRSCEEAEISWIERYTLQITRALLILVPDPAIRYEAVKQALRVYETSGFRVQIKTAS